VRLVAFQEMLACFSGVVISAVFLEEQDHVPPCLPQVVVFPRVGEESTKFSDKRRLMGGNNLPCVSSFNFSARVYFCTVHLQCCIDEE